jgi:hypothetical protein
MNLSLPRAAQAHQRSFSGLFDQPSLNHQVKITNS